VHVIPPGVTLAEVARAGVDKGKPAGLALSRTGSLLVSVQSNRRPPSLRVALPLDLGRPDWGVAQKQAWSVCRAADEEHLTGN
jgi:hypothetical protein